ncbi:MAG: hypothetical protein ACYDCC_14635 [Actinomycetota bacterium]
MRRWFLTLISLMLVAPAGARAAAPNLAPVHDAARAGASMRAMAKDFDLGASPASEIAAASKLDGTPITIPQTPSASFGDAIQALYRASGVPEVTVIPPRADIATSAAPVIASVARAITMTKAALANITPSERYWALTHLDQFETPWTPSARKLASIASRVDVSLMREAAAGIAQSIESLPKKFAAADSWVDPNGCIEIGGTTGATYTTDRVLFIGLGGSDTHYDSTGAIGPVITNPCHVPVSVSVSVGGDDLYSVTSPNQPGNSIVTQGAGLGGIGLVIDRWGNDSYNATLSGSYPISACAPDPVFGGFPGQFPQTIFAQGVGALGVGGLFHLSGSESLNAQSVTSTPSSCHFYRSYVHAQGAGLQRGLGIEVHDTGTTRRTIQSVSRFSGDPSSQDFVAGSYGQGFGAGGIGLIVDKEGDATTVGYAAASGNFVNGNKGAFATTFVQGAVAGLTEQNGSLSSAALAVTTPAGSVSPCSAAGNAQGTGGGKTLIPTHPCEVAGVGILLDLRVHDFFNAIAVASQPGSNCYVGAVALVGAQGAAAWGGLASLITLDVGKQDSFSINPQATGGPCSGDNTRAVGVGQGFGGEVKYPIWDDPNSYYSAVDEISTPPTPTGVGASARIVAPPIGILVSGAPPCVADPTTAKVAIPSTGTSVDAGIDCNASLQSLTASSNAFYSQPFAYNPSGVAQADSWVQGSGGKPRVPIAETIDGYTIGAPGIGVLVNASGNAVFYSAPYANGASPFTQSTSVAQGATIDGIGALVDLIGNDAYVSAPTVGGGTITNIRQGQAINGGTVLPIAVLADVGGHDSYYPSDSCRHDGGVTSAAIWGTFGSGSCNSGTGTLTIGIDALSGVDL